MNTVDFSETIAACDLKVDADMRVCEYERSMSFLDIGPRLFTYKKKTVKFAFLVNRCPIFNQILYVSF